MAEIAQISPDAASWLERFPPSSWALPHFQKTRYGHLSSNVKEFHKWVLEALELPVVQVISRIHDKLVNEFSNQRLKSQTWDSILSPSAEKRIKEAMDCATAYQVLRSDPVEFEVISNERSDIVNIETCCCSCHAWQLYGIPCCHGAAALMYSRKDVYEFTERFFRADNYRKTYSTEIHMVCKVKWRDELGNGEERVVRPPKLRRSAGRPEKKRVCVDDVSREKHTVRCGRCNQTGHYKTTCKQEVLSTGRC